MTVAAAAGRVAAQKGAASSAAKSAPRPRARKTTGKPRARRKPPAATDDLVASGTSTTGQPLPYSGEKKPPEEPQASGKQSEKKPPAAGGQGRSMPQLPQSGAMRDGSWAILGFLAWGWVIMPFLEGGLPGMKKVLLAKFFNKKPDGSYY